MKYLRIICLIIPIFAVSISAVVIFKKYQEIKELKDEQNNNNSKVLHDK
jgi:heme/copper-type cytochrome/quinol oxidase subunit 2